MANFALKIAPLALLLAGCSQEEQGQAVAPNGYEPGPELTEEGLLNVPPPEELGLFNLDDLEPVEVERVSIRVTKTDVDNLLAAVKETGSVDLALLELGEGLSEEVVNAVRHGYSVASAHPIINNIDNWYNGDPEKWDKAQERSTNKLFVIAKYEAYHQVGLLSEDREPFLIAYQSMALCGRNSLSDFDLVQRYVRNEGNCSPHSYRELEDWELQQIKEDMADVAFQVGYYMDVNEVDWSNKSDE